MFYRKKVLILLMVLMINHLHHVVRSLLSANESLWMVITDQ